LGSNFYVLGYKECEEYLIYLDGFVVTNAMNKNAVPQMTLFLLSSFVVQVEQSGRCVCVCVCAQTVTFKQNDLDLDDLYAGPS